MQDTRGEEPCIQSPPNPVSTPHGTLRHALVSVVSERVKNAHSTQYVLCVLMVQETPWFISSECA